jgi:hypothetical protein
LESKLVLFESHDTNLSKNLNGQSVTSLNDKSDVKQKERALRIAKLKKRKGYLSGVD